MTEKRFTIDVLDENNWLIQDTKTGENANPIDGTTNVLKGLISTLNKFNDKNEQLKSKNRGLQSELQIFKEDVTHSNLQINKLADENEQLKHRIEKLQNELNNCEEDYILEEYL